MMENRTLLFTLFFFASFLLSFFVTRYVGSLALALGIRDVPDSARKIHDAPKPKLGGISLYVSFCLMVIILAMLGLSDEISGLKLAGLISGGAILIMGGILDD